MIETLGLWISRVFRKTAPDPFVLVVLLSLLTVALALAFGTFPSLARQGGEPGLGARALALLDAWSGNEGLWKFLAFGMQMCLMLLTGHALAATRPVRALIDRLARVPRGGASAAAMVGFIACATALINWGMGLVVGALLARDVARSMSRRGIPVHYPLLAAAGYTGLLIWHGGLSGSAPLSMTRLDQAQRVLPKDFLASLPDGGASLMVGLDRTLGSSMNLFITLGLLAIIPAMLALLSPRRPQDVVTIDRLAPGMMDPAEPAADLRDAEAPTIPDRLDRSPLLAWAVALPLGLFLYRSIDRSGLGLLGLTEITALMMSLGLVLHGSLRRYAGAVERGAGDCAGIVIQFPLYGGILAMMSVSGLAESFSRFMAEQASAGTLPLWTFLAASVLNMFITSGGGLWGVQGPIALQSGLALGVPPEKMIMAVAYGDQVTNMLQPFWALPLLAITGVRARDIVGYTCVVMFAGYLWIGLGLVLF